MNPWLRIPLADYEAHMALPSVGQAALLAQLFARAVDENAPRSLALAGCAGGNGLEVLESKSIERVVAVDISPAFIDETRARFAGRIRGLELVVADVQSDALAFAPVDLIFAGLLFEYVDVERALTNLRAKLAPRGTLIAVLQLPSTIAEVTPSPYTSLVTLGPAMRLVDPSTLSHVAQEHGLTQRDSETAMASGGKHFEILTFEAP